MKRKITTNPGRLNSLESKNMNEPEKALRAHVLAKLLERKIIKTLDINTFNFLKVCQHFQQHNQLKIFIDLLTGLELPLQDNIENSDTSKSFQRKIQINHEL